MSVVKYGNGDYHRIGYNNSTYRKVAYGTEPVKTLMWKVSETASVIGGTVSSAIYAGISPNEANMIASSYTQYHATARIGISNPYFAKITYCTGMYTQYNPDTGLAVNGGTFSWPFAATDGSTFGITLPHYKRTAKTVRTVTNTTYITLATGSYTSRQISYLSSGTYYSTTSRANYTEASGTQTVTHVCSND